LPFDFLPKYYPLITQQATKMWQSIPEIPLAPVYFHILDDGGSFDIRR